MYTRCYTNAATMWMHSTTNTTTEARAMEAKCDIYLKQLIQMSCCDWKQAETLVNQKIQQQIINTANTVMRNTNTMMRQQIQYNQYMLNNMKMRRQENLQPIQMPQNNVNQSSNNNINSVPKNSIDDQITGYLNEIRMYVENAIPSLLEQKELDYSFDENWRVLLFIQYKLSTVLMSFSKCNKKDSDYLEYSACIDNFFEYWRQITEKEKLYKSFLDYVAKSFSDPNDSQVISQLKSKNVVNAKALLKSKESQPNNGDTVERSKLAKRYNGFVAIGVTYKKQDIYGLRKYLTQLHGWIQAEYKWITDNDNNVNPEEMNLFCNVCNYYANVAEHFLNLVQSDYGDIFDLNDELFKLYQDKFKGIEGANKSEQEVSGYAARKLHWLEMKFSSSSPAMFVVAKQFTRYQTNCNDHITKLREQLSMPNLESEEGKNMLIISTGTR